jgi:hypothetical protein
VDALAALPTLALATEVEGLFGPQGIYTRSDQSGPDWEVATSAELVAPGEPGFQVECGLRIQGGAFRSHGLTRKHSLRLLFKKQYGPGKLNYPLFGEAGPDAFETITLRANSNDGWQWSGAGSRPLYIRDAFARATRRAMGGVASQGRFVHVYINGIYWGVYEAVERPDAAFAATHFGGERADWDAVNSGSAVDGDLAVWNALMGAGGLADDARYGALAGVGAPQLIDPASYADYMLTNLYVGNTDWPQKNYYAARDRVWAVGFLFFMWDAEVVDGHPLRARHRPHRRERGGGPPVERPEAERGVPPAGGRPGPPPPLRRRGALRRSRGACVGSRSARAQLAGGPLRGPGRAGRAGPGGRVGALGRPSRSSPACPAPAARITRPPPPSTASAWPSTRPVARWATSPSSTKTGTTPPPSVASGIPPSRPPTPITPWPTDVMAYIGTYNSGAAKIAMPKLNQAGLVMISPANTWPGLTKPGIGEPNEPMVYRPTGKINYFRVVPADDIQGRRRRRVVQGTGGKKVFILTTGALRQGHRQHLPEDRQEHRPASHRLRRHRPQGLEL